MPAHFKTPLVPTTAAAPSPMFQANLDDPYQFGYPHTAERRQLQLMPLHLKNASICPAVFQILERMTAASPTKTQ